MKRQRIVSFYFSFRFQRPFPLTLDNRDECSSVFSLPSDLFENSFNDRHFLSASFSIGRSINCLLYTSYSDSSKVAQDSTLLSLPLFIRLAHNQSLRHTSPTRRLSSAFLPLHQQMTQSHFVGRQPGSIV